MPQCPFGKKGPPAKTLVLRLEEHGPSGMAWPGGWTPGQYSPIGGLQARPYTLYALIPVYGPVTAPLALGPFRLVLLRSLKPEFRRIKNKVLKVLISGGNGSRRV